MTYYGRAPEGLASKTSATDPVSDADREAERVIRELLSAERPDDGLVGEEGSRIEGEHGRRWIVDPLDGTVNFLYGLRAWGVSIALEDERRAGGGRGLQPRERRVLRRRARQGGHHERSADPRDRLPLAGPGDGGHGLLVRGRAARRAGRAAASSCCPRIRDLRRAGAAALDLAYVAAGRVDAYYERGLKRWDEAAGLPAGARGGRRDRGAATASRTAWWPRRRRSCSKSFGRSWPSRRRSAAGSRPAPGSACR